MKPPPRTSRAAAQFSWTVPLRPPLRRHRRLASAAYRLGAISLGGIVALAMAEARRGVGWRFLAAELALLACGVAGLLLGRAAARRADELEREIARIEEEAARHLD